MRTTRHQVIVLVLFALHTGPLSAQHPVRCWSDPEPPYLILHKCFEELCRCSNDTLDCSSNFGNLTYVPSVMDNVQVLNFSNNNLGQIDDDDFFRNVSDTVWLIDLFYNELTYIARGAFGRFHNLKTLLLGGNNLTYPTLQPVFAVPSLIRLQIICGQLSSIPSGVFDKVSMKNLVELDMSWNTVESLDMQVLQPLHYLRNFSLWNNKLYNLTTATMQNLMTLSLYENRLFDFPVTCKEGTNESLFPSLVELHLRYNMIEDIGENVCLPKLRFLNLQYNRFMYFKPNLFSTHKFPRLSDLFLNQMESKIQQIDAYAFNNSSVYVIDLRLNNVDFSSSKIHVKAFAGCSHLEHITLEKNDFSSVSDKKMFELFAHLPSLRILNLGDTDISRLTTSTFAELKTLEILTLFQNSISHVPDGAFDQLSKLTNIQLDRNQIPFISETAFNETTQKRLTLLDLGGNPFDCSCQILWLQHWMRQRPTLFFDYHSTGYRCRDRNLTLNQFYIDEQACLLSRTNSIIIIVVCSTFIICFTAILLLFGYRWHLRLKLYECCRGRDRRHWAQRRARRFQFDLFVSYAEEDAGWVKGELLPLLEGQWGLKLCVHQRDFIPGKHIVDNISYCVEESERILMVFSRHFASSEWCQFELKMCQTVAMDRDDVLVLVTLDRTACYELTGAMLAVISTTTYIEWEAQCEDRTPFWGRLRVALNDIFTNAAAADDRDEEMLLE